MSGFWPAAVALVVYAATVFYRARLMAVTKFCHDVKHCVRRHRIVFVKPPNKPMRAVLKHY